MAIGTTTISWTDLVFEEGTTTSSSGWTCDRDGLYLLQVSLRCANTATARTQEQKVLKNGVVLVGSTIANVTDTARASCSVLEHLVVGDVITSTCTISGHATSIAANGSFIAGTRIGPKSWR